MEIESVQGGYGGKAGLVARAFRPFECIDHVELSLPIPAALKIRLAAAGALEKSDFYLSRHGTGFRTI